MDPNWLPPSGPIPSTSAFPKNKEEYRILYYWLAQYDASDVNVPAENVTFDASALDDDESIFKTRALFSNVGREMADVKILQVQPQHFLLAHLDHGGKFSIKDARPDGSIYDYVDPIAAAWWFQDFNYSKNPHYQRASVMNRGLIYAISELIILDHQHDEENYLRTDFIGGSLIKLAVTYEAGKKLLPNIVQKSYETLLLKMFERAETLPLNKTFGDMEVQAAVGMYYTAKALNDSSLMKRAATRAEEIYSTVINGAGFEKHEGSADVVYQGIYLFYSAWLLTATQYNPDAAKLYEFLIPYVDRGCKFLNYMTIVEPNGPNGEIRITGPSHFNAANNGSPRNLIWNTGMRGYLGGAMYSNQCKTRLFNQNGASYNQFPLTESTSKIKNDLKSFMSPTNYINRGDESTSSEWAINFNNPSAPTGDWSYENWSSALSTVFTYSFYKKNFYRELMDDLTNNKQWTKYPFKFSSNYIETLDDINEPTANKKAWFVIAKSSTLHTIWHVGSLAWRNKEATNIAGFGGGAISSVSTVGPVIMGRERGNQTQMHTLSEWRIWATHHMAGADENSKYFGTARDRDLIRTLTKNGNQTIKAVITGVIGPTNNKTAPNGSITGSVNYRREFNFSQSTGITVESILNTNATDQAKELYEIIPVYLYDEEINDIVANPQEKTTISFYKSGAWVTPSTTITTNVTDIRLNRYNAPLYIHFATAQSVKLSPSEMVQTIGHDSSHSRNILIDLLKNNGAVVTLPTQVKINYTMDTVAP